MNSKQECIAKSYGEYWEIAKQYVDENGWIDRFKQSYYLNIGNWGLEEPPIIKNILGFNDHGGIQIYNDKWRPITLRGIENNNGWVKIESEEDLPKETDSYFVRHKDGSVICHHFSTHSDFDRLLFLDEMTHYQPITKPKPPLH